MTLHIAAQPQHGAWLPTLAATDADFVLRVRPDGRLLAASDTVADVLGWDLQRCADEGIWTAIADEAQCAAVRQMLRHVLATGSARTTLQVSAAGTGLWVDVAAKHLLDEPGTPVLICARDVSDDLIAAAELAASEQQWRVAFEHSPIGGALLDDDGAILVVNEALCRMLGRRQHELTRMDVADVVAGQGGLPWRDWWDGLRLGGANTSTVDRVLRSADGTQLWGRLTAARIAPPTLPARVVLQIEDVTGRREAELELANRALHDGLTGSPNRFLTRQWLASALEDDPAARVGVLYCDLDRFKVVNDSLGHAAGDSLLVQVAERLRRPLRPEDLLGRVGGDEFAVLLRDIPNSAAARTAAEALLSRLDGPLAVDGLELPMEASVGVSVAPRDGVAVDELLRCSDIAMYEAKAKRNGVVLYDPSMDPADRVGLHLVAELQTAIAEEQLVVHYQPVVCLRTARTIGAEALVRWQHPVRGLLSPGRFVPVLERSSMIIPLTMYVLEKAVREALTWPEVGGLDLSLSVNLSARCLLAPSVPEQVRQILIRHGMPARRLTLEITETLALADLEVVDDVLSRLRELGVRLSVDDFGTGYSSMSFLRRIAVHEVKVDRSFVTDAPTCPGDRAIVVGTVALAHGLGLTVVGEGVETTAQLRMLQRSGCDAAQGYLLGRPMPAEVFRRDLSQLHVDVAALIAAPEQRNPLPVGTH